MNDWKLVINLLNDVAANLGNNVSDTRCGKNWDVGQAVCAEAYGENWMSDPVFIAWNNRDEVEPHYFECLQKMAEGHIPEWVEVGE